MTPIPCAFNSRMIANRAVDFLQRQRGTWLVHDNDPRVLRQSLGDFDDLLLGNGQRSAHGLRIERHTKSLEEPPRPLMFVASSNPTQRPAFLPQEDVLAKRSVPGRD